MTFYPMKMMKIPHQQLWKTIRLTHQSSIEFFINDEVILHQGEEVQAEKVILCAIDEDGRVIVSFNKNTILDKMVYDVEFPDRQKKQYYS